MNFGEKFHVLSEIVIRWNWNNLAHYLEENFRFVSEIEFESFYEIFSRQIRHWTSLLRDKPNMYESASQWKLQIILFSYNYLSWKDPKYHYGFAKMGYEHGYVLQKFLDFTMKERDIFNLNKGESIVLGQGD